jgi:hypothetical protein
MKLTTNRRLRDNAVTPLSQKSQLNEGQAQSKLSVEVLSLRQESANLWCTVVDNQGIGPDRTSYPGVTVTESATGQVVATYAVDGRMPPGMARPLYQDQATGGSLFLLLGPSLKAKGYQLNVKFNANGATGLLSDPNLTCTVFGGAVLP